MKKLFLVYLRMFLIAIPAVALVKLFAVFVIHVFYGGNYSWSIDDLWFVLKQGAFVGLLFCIFATISYVKNH